MLAGRTATRRARVAAPRFSCAQQQLGFADPYIEIRLGQGRSVVAVAPEPYFRLRTQDLHGPWTQNLHTSPDHTSHNSTTLPIPLHSFDAEFIQTLKLHQATMR